MFQIELRAGVDTALRAQPEGLLGHFRSAVVQWLVFPPVARKTRVQFPAAELFFVSFFLF